MIALLSRCYSGHHNAAEKEGDPGTPGKEIRSKNNVDGGLQVRLEKDGSGSIRHMEWSVALAPQGIS